MSKPKPGPISVAAFATLAAWAVASAPALSQGSPDWQRPSGFVPEPRPTQRLAPAMVGPITFDEAEFPFAGAVDGLVVTSISGTSLPAPLAFSFTSSDASISGGPGTTAFVDDPAVEGDASGTLTVDFGLDVTRLAFGFAQNCAAPSAPGATVTARDAGLAVVGTATVPGQDFGFFFLENQLDLAPGEPFRTVEVSFDTAGGACNRFVLDNLAYDAAAIPTLSELGLGALQLLLLALGIRVLKHNRRVPARSPKPDLRPL